MKPLQNARPVLLERLVSSAPDYATDRTRKLAIQYSWKAVYDWGLPYDDREDLQRDLHLALWQKQSRFDARRGESAAFLRQVAKNECIKLLKKRTAARRDYRLDVTLDEKACQTKIGTSKDLRRVEKRLIRAIDVRRAIASLSAMLRRIAIALQESSPADLPLSLGVSRATLYRLIASIRANFMLQGVDEMICQFEAFRGSLKEITDREKS